MRKIKNDELNRLSEDDFKAAQKMPVVIVLDNIRSMHNVGAAFRTSDAFRIEKIFLTGITAQPPHRDIHKAALGATETVSWEYVETTLEAIQKLKSQGYQIISIEQADQSTLLHDFEPKTDMKYALVFGNEVFGVAEEVIKESDAVLEIPQFGTKHSINVSVSIGVVTWDLYAKMRPF